MLNRNRIEHLQSNLKLHYGDLTDSSSLNRILEKVQPYEIYNLAAQSHVGISFELPEYSNIVNSIGTIRILDAIKEIGLSCKFYQASTSELYGKVQEVPQTEITPFYPRSPYAFSKLAAFWSVVNYREAFDLYACNGILFNHESPRRGENFVTRKITLGLASILAGKQKCLEMGNIESKRDWGYAPDYVEMMWIMLQQEKPEDYVVATNTTHSIREFIEFACSLVDVEIVWRGKGIDEVGVNRKTNKIIVKIDPSYYRPTEVDLLIGNPQKAKKQLGWEPKVQFRDLVKIMLTADCKLHNIIL